MIFNNLLRVFGQQAKNSPFVNSQSILLNESDAAALLGRFFNLTHLKQIVEQGQESVKPRVAQRTISEAGLLAIAAYTSAGLDRMIHEAHSPMGGPRDRREMAKALESFILETLPTIALTKASVVKRNLTLDPSLVRSLYRPGALISFDRITSVTLQPHQVYRGGNVDLTIKPEFGVIDVSALSTFSGKTARGEKEGMLEPGKVYEVIDMQSGREDSPLNPQPGGAPLHSEYWRIVLQQCQSS